MTKVNRDQLFKRAFDDFILFICDKYYFKNWKLENKTKNKREQLHEYEFTIPKKIIDYTIDESYIDNEGVRHSKIDEIFNDQEIPNSEDFNNSLIYYFDDYKLIEKNKIVSYVDISDHKISEEGDFRLTIVVKYYKSYMPYHSGKLSLNKIIERNENLEKENKDLLMNNEIIEAAIQNISIRNEYLEVSNDWLTKRKIYLENQLKKTTKNMNTTIFKMEEKIRDLYNKLNDEHKEDCPVCLEKICTEALTVPYCCHYICIECYSRCNKCPLCRDNYVVKVTGSPITPLSL